MADFIKFSDSSISEYDKNKERNAVIYFYQSYIFYKSGKSDESKNALIKAKNDTYIQKEAIIDDFGVYDSPDLFFIEHRQNLGIVKRFVFPYLARFLKTEMVDLWTHCFFF